MIDCKHWSDGKCSLGLYGGRPSPGVCMNACKRREANPAPSKGLGDTVAKVIKTVTLGKVKPCRGCKKRQALLNKIAPYKST